MGCVEEHITGIVFAGSGLLLGIVFRTIKKKTQFTLILLVVTIGE